MTLAAVIGAGAVFSAFAPGAAPASHSDVIEVGQDLSMPTPRLNPALYRDPARFEPADISNSSRQVARAILNDPSYRINTDNPEAASLNVVDGLSLQPRAIVQSGDGWSRSAMGIEVRFAAQPHPDAPNIWIVGGAGRESYAITPAGLRDYTITPVASDGVIGDAHMGIALELSQSSYASLGYMREQREFSLGRENWEEDEHFIGVGFHARW